MTEELPWSTIWLAASAAFFCIAMGALWFFTRKVPLEETWHPTPEIEHRRLSQRARVRLVVSVPIVIVTLGWALLGAMLGSVTVTPAQPPDFDSDSWAAECNSSTARNTVRRWDQRTRTLAGSCGSFTGAHTLWRIYTPQGGEEITIEYRIEVEEGRGDLVLVWPDGTVTRLSGESSPCTFTAGAGETRLRLIGDRGKLEYTVTIPSRNGQWMDG